MRRVITLISIVLLTACKSNTDFIIDGIITNADDGEMICLSYPVKHGDIWYKQRDTTYISDGHFYFEGKVDGVVPAHLSFQNMDQVQLFLEPSNIEFSAERSAMYDYAVSGLSIDGDLTEYRKAFAEYDKAIYEKSYEVMRKNEAWSKAYDAGSADADKLWSEFYAILLEHHAIGNKWQDLAIEFLKSHPHNALTPNIIDGLIRSGYDEQKVDYLISVLSAEQRQSVLSELMTIRHDISKLNGGEVGSKALNFTLRSIDGSQVTLSECYANGYVLLDFWASWCRPCIGEIPNVRKLHAEYGDRVEILSISVDSDAIKWREAVAQHSLMEWQQLIVERADDADAYYYPEQADISLAYNVEQIPCFILIDKEGIILGRWTHITPTTTAEIERLIGANK